MADKTYLRIRYVFLIHFIVNFPFFPLIITFLVGVPLYGSFAVDSCLSFQGPSFFRTDYFPHFWGLIYSYSSFWRHSLFFKTNVYSCFLSVPEFFFLFIFLPLSIFDFRDRSPDIIFFISFCFFPRERWLFEIEIDNFFLQLFMHAWIQFWIHQFLANPEAFSF